MRETEASLRRTGLLLAFLVTIFVLLAEGVVKNAGPFDLTDYGLVQKLTPLAIAYTYYELMSLTAMRMLLRRVHDAVLAKFYPAIGDNDLEYYLMPHSTFVIEEVFEQAAKGRSKRAFKVATAVPFGLALAVGPLLFEIYAFRECLRPRTFGLTDIVVWVVIIASTALLFMGFMFFWNLNNPNLRPRKSRVSES